LSKAFISEQVEWIHHWNDRLFSFRTSRDPGFRFRNGHFVMVGMEIEGKPLMRAYSIVSANHEEHLEFFSIKVPKGALTGRLKNLNVGDRVFLSRKPVGTLVLDDLRCGERLFLFATGTGLAPFLSIVKDPETYERFESVHVVHGVRNISDLAYREHLQVELPRHPYLGDMISRQLHYLPCVSRESFRPRGRITDLIENGELANAYDLAPLDPVTDKAMICGSPEMLSDMRSILDQRGFQASPQQGVPGDYVFERAFVS